MSRRTSLSTLGRQQRAASRMTPGTRMWSEQPYINPVGRAVVTEPDYVKPVTLPQLATWQYGNTVNTPGDYSYQWTGKRVPVEGAESIMAVSSLAQAVTLGAGWRMLASGGVFPHFWAIGHRVWGTDAVFDFSLGPIQPSDGAVKSGAKYAAFTFEGMSGGGWDVDVVHDATGDNITFRDDPAPFRFGLLMGFTGYSGNWVGAVPDFRAPNGLSGTVNPQDFDAPGWSTIKWFDAQHERACFRPTRPLPTGTYQINSYGEFYAPPRWANVIIRYGASA